MFSLIVLAANNGDSQLDNSLLADLTISQVITAVSFLVFAIGIVVTLVKKIKPWLDALRNFFEDWNGMSARPGVEAKSGVMERLAKLEEMHATVTEIKEEVKPNHGGSLKDQVSRIEKATVPRQKDCNE